MDKIHFIYELFDENHLTSELRGVEIAYSGRKVANSRTSEPRAETLLVIAVAPAKLMKWKLKVVKTTRLNVELWFRVGAWNGCYG